MSIKEASEAAVYPSRGLVAFSVTMWGILFFVSLLSIGLVLSEPGFWLEFAARYWVAAAVLSAASTYAAPRVLADYYSAALLAAERHILLRSRCPEPSVYDAAADVARAVSGLYQLSALWPLAAASLGLIGLYSGVAMYFLARLGARGLEGLGVRTRRRIPSTGVLAAISVASLGLGLMVPAYYLAKLLSDLSKSLKSVMSLGEVAGAENA